MSLILSGTLGLSDVDGTAATPALRGTDSNTGIFFPAADTIAFAEGGVEAMRLDASGILGIGAVPSPWASGLAILDFRNNGGISSDSQYAYLSNNIYYNGSTNLRKASGAVGLFGVGSGGSSVPFVWSYAGTGAANSAISLSEAMRIDSNGRLLIGRTSAFDSSAITASINSAGPYVTYFTNDSTSTSAYCVSRWAQAASGSAVGYVGTGGSAVGNTSFANNFVVGTQSSNPLVFNVNDSERARIDTSGNLLVGTTSGFGQNGQKLQVVNQNGGNWGIAVGNSGGSVLTGCIGFLNSNGTVGAILTSGTSTSYATSSDYRLKEDIQPMTGALAKVAALKPCTYKWKADGSDGEGFIAHELQAVVPQCVTGEKDAVDSDGNPVYQGIDTSFLVATLTAAIKELNAKLEAQAAEIAALKGTA